MRYFTRSYITIRKNIRIRCNLWELGSIFALRYGIYLKNGSISSSPDSIMARYRNVDNMKFCAPVTKIRKWEF